jgi:hypothetical protein
MASRIDESRATKDGAGVRSSLSWTVPLAVLTGLAPAIMLGACGEPVELEGQDLCDEVGYAIANRTFQCENDPELGNRRYEQFQRDYRCQEKVAFEESRDGSICPIDELTCDEVKENGQDLEWWLGASNCSSWFSRADGMPVPAFIDGGPPPSCTGTTVLCGDKCVDIDNDPVNCGGCDLRCHRN